MGVPMLEDYFGIIGMTLAGSFHVEDVIAEGGYAVVYRAEHVAFRAPVALKCLKIPGTVTADQADAFVESFREEAEILFHLSASIPEVVRPLHADALTLDDHTFVPYLVMEWVEGKPLDSIIILRDRDGLPPLGIRTLLEMLTPIAHALSQAHRFQVPGGGAVEVTHCDLKPENIVITEPDQPVAAKILDFGIAKARDLVVEKVGRRDRDAGPFTPNYGAPEQWSPKQYGQTGPWTDVWGMALSLVECLTGRPVLEGDLRDMMAKVLEPSVRPTPIHEGAPGVSPEVEEVFERALAVDPRDRYTTISSFWTALELAAGVPTTFAEESSERAVGGGARGRVDLSRDPSLELDAPFRDGPPAQIGHMEDGLEEFDSGEYELEPASDEAPFAEPEPSGPGVSGGLDDSGVRRQLDLAASEPPRPRPPKRPQQVDLTREPAAPGSDAPFSLAVPSRPPHKPQARPQVPPARPQPSALARELARTDTRREVRSLGAKLLWPGVLIALAFVLTFVDMFTAGRTGGFVMIGPVRLRWIAGLLAFGGIGWAIWNLLVGRQEE